MHPWKIFFFAFRFMFYLVHLSTCCETDGDCAEGLCLGGACDCPENRYGEFCMKDCTLDQHCNGGTCRENWTCECLDGQYGIQCDDFCTSHSDCSGGGTCVVRNAVKICECNDLHYGAHCENVHECTAETTCKTGWECDMGQEPFVCREGTSTESNLEMQPLNLNDDSTCPSSDAPRTSTKSTPSFCLGILVVSIVSLL